MIDTEEKVRDRAAEKIIFENAHDIKRVAELFGKTYQYLRKRRDCPGTDQFYKAIKFLDAIALKNCMFIKGRYDE